MKKKLCFFDIDGTLVDFGKKEILPATAKALKEAQAAGHRLFLCTGRSRGQIPGWLLVYGFDGIVASAGAYVEYQGEKIFRQSLPLPLIEKMVSFFTGNDIPFILQGQEGHCARREDYERMIVAQAKELGSTVQEMRSAFGEIKLVDGLSADGVRTRPERYGRLETAVYKESPFGLEEVQEALGCELKVTAASFNRRNDSNGEVTRMGIHKAFGMQKVIELLHAKREDTVAFGDGANDMDMLAFAGLGVAMGNAPDFVKEAADMVTAPVGEDGIGQAMKKIGLIGQDC